MTCVNQTRPQCVNQMGKTQSKPLAVRHGRETAWYVLISLKSVLDRPLTTLASDKFAAHNTRCTHAVYLSAFLWILEKTGIYCNNCTTNILGFLLLKQVVRIFTTELEMVN
jgi:hypothetical protein